MNVTAKLLASAALLLGVSLNASAVPCNSFADWGSLGPPDSQTFSASYTSAGSRNSCYTFSLSSAADSVGGVIESDGFLNKLDIDVTSVSLFGGGVSGGSTLGSLFGSSAPAAFSFGGLGSGIYTLVVSSIVTNELGLFNGEVGYRGQISTSRSSVKVPEPGTLLLLSLGLIGIGVSRRRRLTP